MKYNLIRAKVELTKEMEYVDVDFEKILKIIAQAADFDINALTDEQKDDIICEFESTNWVDYLTQIGLNIVDLTDEISPDRLENKPIIGYDMDSNNMAVRQIFKDFAEFVYNY